MNIYSDKEWAEAKIWIDQHRHLMKHGWATMIPGNDKLYFRRDDDCYLPDCKFYTHEEAVRIQNEIENG